MLYIHPFIVWCLVLIAAILTLRRSVPALIQGLANQAPFEYNELGCPDMDDFNASLPSTLQWKFVWFVLNGRAYAVTRGSARSAALWTWIGYVTIAVAFPTTCFTLEMFR